ncbi:hypothetical protein [Spirosoma sp. KUDC1026]|uniref:hypothetical protein n=1 Tax=Spirosoma sp. KUDC1026 TaxID=2745947 RepID=UPI00159BDC44|nr:hypothetical protein [Spirosoma sp. KUDC1026]QKZ14187.1 hypothetical protein HU175_16755 [Spirosoma sp. KUDC1026]
MKTLVGLLLFLATATVSFGQADETSLTRDMVFDRTALKNLRFPPKAFRQEKSVRIYMRFTLTPKGEYQDVAIVNSNPIDDSFTEEFNRLRLYLPKQDPKYAGRYVAPIAFLFGDHSPDKLAPISNETDTIVEKKGYKLLEELPMISYVLCEKRTDYGLSLLSPRPAHIFDAAIKQPAQLTQKR